MSDRITAGGGVDQSKFQVTDDVTPDGQLKLYLEGEEL